MPDNKQIEAATKELQEVCAKHNVEVVAYIHSLGPRIAIIPTNEEPKDSPSGQDEKAGERLPEDDKRPVAEPQPQSSANSRD